MTKCCLTSTETVGLLGTGAQDGHLDFHTATELWARGQARKISGLKYARTRIQTVYIPVL